MRKQCEARKIEKTDPLKMGCKRCDSSWDVGTTWNGRPRPTSCLDYQNLCEVENSDQMAYIRRELDWDIKIVDTTIEERESLNGSFVEQSAFAQNLKLFFQESKNWESLPSYMKESLEMTATKISRILNGDPTHADSWHDIQGYARLVEVILNDNE